MTDKLTPQDFLDKIRSALLLLDAITVIVREGTHAQLVIPFKDVTVTLNVSVARIEQREAPAIEVVKH